MPNLMLFDCMRSADQVFIDGLRAELQEQEDGSMLCRAGQGEQIQWWRFEDQEVTLGEEEAGYAAAVAEREDSDKGGAVVLLAFEKQGPLLASEVKQSCV